MFVDKATLILDDDNFLYVMGYAYGYNGAALPARALTHTDKDTSLIMGIHDADADQREGAPPTCDFDCGWLIQREIGTIISVFSNPIVEIGTPRAKIYVLGCHPTIEGYCGALRSEAKNFATSDRAWEIYFG